MSKIFSGNILVVGFGAIGQALLIPLMQYFNLESKQIHILTADVEGQAIAAHSNIDFEVLALTPTNFASILNKYLTASDLLINVSVEVSSIDLIKWCQQHEVLYLDTCIEPWAGGYQSAAMDETTNYYLRYHALENHTPDSVTAVLAHGANPGLVSHFVKQGLLELAKKSGVEIWDNYAELANKLGIKVIQIAERDTQTTQTKRLANEFRNTWSVQGLISEAKQPAELGWGSHEDTFPADVQRHTFGDQSGIYFNTESIRTSVKSWVPSKGEQLAYLISHHEALSIANFLTLRDSEGNILYRPTVYFAYCPSDEARDSLEEWHTNGFTKPVQSKVMKEEIIYGYDELGTLFVFKGGAYWYGSTLEIQEARKLAPFNNATTLQVVAGILGALEWMLLNPKASVVEPENLDHHQILQTALPFLGNVRGVFTDWQPAIQSKLQFNDFRITE